LDYYTKFLKAATGLDLNMNKLLLISDRIFNLIRSFWLREYKPEWNRNMDVPPARWFEEPFKKGPHSGQSLDFESYNKMLDIYYAKRGWDRRGIPTKTTLKRLGLGKVIQELQGSVNLAP
jgi:aldehyde:ferredoxin oxidoreductase